MSCRTASGGVTTTNSATQGTSSASGRDCHHITVKITADGGRGKVYRPADYVLDIDCNIVIVGSSLRVSRTLTWLIQRGTGRALLVVTA